MTRDTEKCDDVTVVRGDKELLVVVVEIFCVPSESKLSDYSSRLQTEQQVAHSTASTHQHRNNKPECGGILREYQAY